MLILSIMKIWKNKFGHIIVDLESSVASLYILYFMKLFTDWNICYFDCQGQSETHALKIDFI